MLPWTHLRRELLAGAVPGGLPDFILATGVASDVLIPPEASGYRSVAAILVKGGVAHVIAALDNDLIFDSNTDACPPVVAPWRGRTLHDAVPVCSMYQLDARNHSIVLASPSFLSEDAGSREAMARRVLAAAYQHTEYMSDHVLAPAPAPATASREGWRLWLNQKQLAASWMADGMVQKSIHVDRLERLVEVRWRLR